MPRDSLDITQPGPATGLTFDGCGPFASGLTPSERGARAVRLTKACAVAREARPVAVALGRCADPAGLGEALRLFNAMPSIPRRHVLARYQALSRGRG